MREDSKVKLKKVKEYLTTALKELEDINTYDPDTNLQVLDAEYLVSEILSDIENILGYS